MATAGLDRVSGSKGYGVSIMIGVYGSVLEGKKHEDINGQIWVVVGCNEVGVTYWSKVYPNGKTGKKLYGGGTLESAAKVMMRKFERGEG